ncbi:MAG: cupin domain-containing protein, partial [Trichococcus sp.]|uniref:cupin domain-containing protein n=1 Tax=Trichococcus sp. TaxID=1985464 RepID=UPI003C57E413
MAYTHVQTFNPEILYAFDPLSEAGNYSKTHSHNFLEISILLEGEADYLVDGIRQDLGTGTVMLFNPGVKHAERQKEGTFSHQLHIGLTNLSLNGLPRNHFPNKRALLDLGCYADAFMEKAWRVTKEFNEQRSE